MARFLPSGISLLSTGESPGLWGRVTNANLEMLLGMSQLTHTATSSVVEVNVSAGVYSTINHAAVYRFPSTFSTGTNNTLRFLQTGAARVVLVINDSTIPVRVESGSNNGEVPPQSSSFVAIDGAGNVNVADFGGGVDWNPTFVNSNTNLEVNTGYFVNLGGGEITLTLPVDPVVGDEIRVFDVNGSSATNNIIVATTDTTAIAGDTANFIIDVNLAHASFVYDGSSWQVV